MATSAIAADFLRRWNESDLVETRHLIGQFETPEQLSTEFQKYVASNSMQAFVLNRELDYFEPLAALGTDVYPMFSGLVARMRAELE